MQMIERNRRLVKDDPSRSEGIAGCGVGSGLRKRSVPVKLHHQWEGFVTPTVADVSFVGIVTSTVFTALYLVTRDIRIQ